MRVVLDTNVIVSAVISPAGPPGHLFRLWADGRFELVTSHPQFDEIAEVLMRPKLARYIKPDEAIQRLEELRQVAIFAEDLPDIDASPDPDDNVILATAVAGKANMLISGDTRHVLPLGNVNGIPILSPVEALAQFAPPRQLG